MRDTKYERINTGGDHTEDDVHETSSTNNPIVNQNDQARLEFHTSAGSRKMSVMQKSITTIILIKIYFTLSIGLTFYQRRILADVKFPFSIAIYHFFLKFFLAFVIRIVYRCWTGRSRVLLSFRPWVSKIGPTGIASGLDIGFSNWGLELVNISLYTMTKSTAIIFILIFAILLGLEQKSWSLALIVAMISGGLFLVTYKSTSFDALGFCVLLFASLSSGVRWTLAQLIMQKTKMGLQNPIDMVFHMQPFMALSLIPFLFIFESGRIAENWDILSAMTSATVTLWILKISVGAVVAFAMECSEFMVVHKTSSLTLTITGIFKEICQIVLAVLINGDTLSLINVCGLLFCVSGIICHVLHKYREHLNTETNETESAVTYSKNWNDDHHHQKRVAATRKGQQIPLLEADDMGNSDTDDSQNDNQNASEIIFDVLRSRDTRR